MEVEATVASAEAGAGAALERTAAYRVASLLRETDWLVALSFILLVFILAFPFFVSVNIFAFSEASTSNVFFSKTKKTK